MAEVEKIVPSAEEEIRALEAKLAEKKRALAEAGEPMREEKEIFREVVREHIAEVQPPIVAPAPASPSPGTAKPITQDPQAVAAREQKINALIERAMTSSIEAAVRAAETESPYLVDELHDRLADHYYEKLVQLRKLEQL